MFCNRHVLLAVAAVFFAGAALFATGLQTAPMLACLAGSAGAFAIFASGLRTGDLLAREVDRGWLLACVAIGLVLALLGGEGHLFFAKDDWLTRDAVLADLVLRWLPVPYAAGDDAVSLLRAPLGMYLLPAAAGRIFGLGAHLALAAQTGAILGGFFYCVTLIWPRRRLAFVALFVVFSGLDVLPVLMETQGQWLPRYLAFWVDGMYYPADLSQLFGRPIIFCRACGSRRC